MQNKVARWPDVMIHASGETCNPDPRKDGVIFMQKIKLLEYEEINARDGYELLSDTIRIERPVMVDGRYVGPYSVKDEALVDGVRWVVVEVKLLNQWPLPKWVYTLRAVQR